MNNVLPTMYAPAERSAAADIRRLFNRIVATPFMAELLDAVSAGILVLNANRQIVFANRAALILAGLADPFPALGLRPGEALQCVHAAETKAGCGTSEFCRTCGAVRAILASQEGREEEQECRVIRKNDGSALDLRVRAVPFRVGNEALTMFSVIDISDEKRRKALERIFFHDILNTASGIKGFAELLKDADSGEVKQYQETIFSLARMIVDEINSQRTLTAAENNELKLNPSKIRALELLNEIVNLYKNHDVAAGRQLRIDQKADDAELVTDRPLLQRVIGNMTKNALEACQPGETVTLGCSAQMKQVQFWVHNPNEMPREVQLQVFERSFSTKGVGRGLGTYSIKLLTERYLKGAASFVSGRDGTIFRVSYPLSISSA